MMSYEYVLQMPAGQEPLPVSPVEATATTLQPELSNTESSHTNLDIIGFSSSIVAVTAIALYAAKRSKEPYDKELHQNAAKDYASRGRIRAEKRIRDETEANK
ncbi:hypothetical protein BH10PAT3_BH10PAT3_4720 [soil metagenome]